MKRVGSRNFLGRVAGTVTLLAAPLGVIDRAHGACDQTAPVNNTTVTCSGTTTNANPPNGWGTGVETGDTIIVQAGASVSTTTAIGSGIALLNGTVNNLGTITGGAQGAGISAVDLINGVTVNNSGTIGAGIGIFGGNSVNVVNDAAASISGTSFGILSQAAIINAINATNSGKIEATGADGSAIAALGTATVTNLSGGIIAANGQNGTAIRGQTVIVTGNAGTIEAGIGAGITGGVAIKADAPGGTADVTTSSAIQASSIAIVTDGLLTLNNTGSITSGGDVLRSLNGAVNVTNSGTIATTDAGATAILARTDVTLNNSGIIQAIHRAISGGNVSITNTNTIAVNGVAGSGANAIQANVLNLDNSGSIFVTGPGAVGAVNAISGNSTIKNSGTIVANVDNTFAIKSDLGALDLSVPVWWFDSQANGANGVAIRAATNSTVANAGRIEASGAAGPAPPSPPETPPR